jgi:type IV pilus assembly protein PilE
MHAARGFTLFEVLVAAAIAAVLISLAVPPFLHSQTKARRADAVAALMKLQFAQEQYRAHHGSYAPQLAVLRGAAPASEGGLYDIVLDQAAGERYRARALARADRAQSADRECAEITIAVDGGIASFGPLPRCWGR